MFEELNTNDHKEKNEIIVENNLVNNYFQFPLNERLKNKKYNNQDKNTKIIYPKDNSNDNIEYDDIKINKKNSI